MLNRTMKNRTGVIVLAIVCAGLLIALFAVKKSATDQKSKDNDTISTLTTTNNELSKSLKEEATVSQALRDMVSVANTEKAALTNQLTDASNALGQVSTKLSQVSATLDQTQNALKTAQEDVTKRDARIADLESQNAALDRRALTLSTAITNLTDQINETKRKLAASEGDKAFLETELQRLMAEKADMEKQFNDLNVLRTQVARLKEELDISRRLDWIRKGLFAAADQKGAQHLLQSGPTAPGATPPPSRYDLNVEVNADGSVRIIEPLTNRPAATNPPAAR